MDPFSQLSSTSLTMKGTSSWSWKALQLLPQSMFCLLWASFISLKKVLTTYIYSIFINQCPCVPGKAPFLALLMDVESPKSHVMIYFLVTSASLTFLFMLASDIFVRISRISSQPSPPNASPTIIINTIPFSTLNISIALTIVVNIIMITFGVVLAPGIPATLLLATLLTTNKKARKHLRLRLRQKIDSLTIGRRNRVEPIVSIALVPIRDTNV